MANDIALAAPKRRVRPSGTYVDQVILKVAQRCNLDCTYCYVYNRGDDSWRDRPALIRRDVVHRLAQRIDEHCRRYGLAAFTVELHGGEPLLLGKQRMDSLLHILRTNCPSVRLHFTLQTNGILLDREWLELFGRHSVSFGISLDGPPEIADRRRVMRGGGGSTQRLLDAIAAIRSHPLFDDLFGGCLCVVDPECDGAALVDWFVDHGFTAFDFLLPDGNRVNLPQGWAGVGPYRRFLLDAFERWYSMGKRAPRIRKFEFMMMGLTGADVPLDALGGDLRRVCVVESDGTIGVSDVARICGGDFSRDILNIFDHALDQHVDRYRIAEIQSVCDTCRSCPYLGSCGGGYLPHRFDGETFDHPSLYCEALYALSECMMRALVADLPEKFWTRSTLR